jgi:cytidylate kinase
MPIVTISRQSYTQAKEVAEKVAEKLGFQCVWRGVLIEASEEFNVPEVKLLQALRDAPFILDRITFGKERYTAYIQAALLHHLQSDNVVYHGLAGHHLVKGISHVLKVRIIGNMEDRVKIVMRRAEVFEQAAVAMKGISMPGLSRPGAPRPISKEKALQVIEESEEARRKWGLHLYGVDTHDPGLYDLVIHINKLSVDDAADLICRAASMDRFRATGESQQAMDDLLLAARIKAKLVERHPRVAVTANEGVVYVSLEGGSSSEAEAIRETVAPISGVEKVDVNVYPFVTPD